MYAPRRFPDEFDFETFRIAHYICVNDVKTGVSCYTRIIISPPDLPYEPSSREIGTVTELAFIDPEMINPLTQLVLRVMKTEKAFAEYHPQMPPLERLAITFADPLGDHYFLDY